jgi:hypothetical protein
MFASLRRGSVLQNQHYRSDDRTDKTMNFDAVTKIMSWVSYSISNGDLVLSRVEQYVRV